MNEYRQERYNKIIELVKLLNSFDNSYKFRLIDNVEEPDQSKIMLNQSVVPICASYQDYEKKYFFYLNYNLPYIKFDTYKTVSQKYKEPQKIGVLTSNKIKAWVEYLTNIYNELLEISATRVRTVEAFKAEVLARGANIDEPFGATSKELFSGSIIKGGIVFSFEVHNEGYISKKLEVHYSVDHDLASFLKLSNNDLKD